MPEHRETSDGFVADWDALLATDPEVAEAISGELRRERSTLRLIASENYASPAVLAAQASTCLLYTSPSPRDGLLSRMPSSA